MAIDYTTDRGQVRLLAADTDEAALLLTDEQIDAFLSIETGIKRAAALALETIAVSEALISKKITTQDLSTDGPAVARELRARAKSLRDQAAVDDEGNSADAWAISLIDFDPNAAESCWG